MAIAGLAYVAAAVLITYCNLWRPEDPGLFIDLDGGSALVTDVAAGSPADRAGLRAGDRIVSWQGRDGAALDWMIIEGNLMLDRPMPIVVEREGARIDVALRLARAPASHWRTREGWMLLAVRAVQLISLVFAGIVAVRGRRDARTYVGAWLLATFAVFMVVPPFRMAAVWRSWPMPIGALVWFPYLSGLAIAAILATFLAVFPRRTLRSPVVWLLAWAPMAAALVQPLRHMAGLVYAPDRVAANAFAGLPLVIVSGVYLAWGLTTLFWNLRRLEDVTERRRVRVVAGGLVVSCLFGAWVIPSYWLAPVDDLGQSLFASPWFAAGTFLLLAIPLSFTYAILTHRLFDVRVIIRQGVRYALARRAILLLAPVFLAAIVLEVALVHGRDDLGTVIRTHLWLYAVVGGLIVLARVQRNRWLDAIDRRFFRQRYDGQQLLRRVAEDLHDAGSIERVAPRLAGQLEEAFQAESAAVLLRDADDGGYRAIASAPAGRAPRPIAGDTKLVGLLGVLGRPLEVGLPDAPWLARQLPPGELQALRDSRIELTVPVGSASGGPTALVVLGPKRSEEPYTDDDKDLLLTIARNLELLIARQPVADGPTDVMEECPRCGACFDAGTTRCPHDGATLETPGAARILAGRYRLDQRLGEGGMGAVYTAVDEALDRRVAVKLVRQALARKSEVADRFQQEARTAASFAHPNVATVHDFGTTGSGPYLIMELLEGRTLRDLLRAEGVLQPARAVGILRGVCAALDVAHRRQLIHRDLKPENVFLVESDTGEMPKILDFGIAKYDTTTPPSSPTRVLTAPGVVLGTPQYMSPEQLRGRDAGPASDIWALGVMAFEMLTGMHPLGDLASGTAELLQEASWVDGTITASDLPVPWKAFFTRALSTDPADRPQTATAFLGGLERALAAGPAPPPPGQP